jgi:hypothetical protein
MVPVQPNPTLVLHAGYLPKTVKVRCPTIGGALRGTHLIGTTVPLLYVEPQR